MHIEDWADLGGVALPEAAIALQLRRVVPFAMLCELESISLRQEALK